MLSLPLSISAGIVFVSPERLGIQFLIFYHTLRTLSRDLRNFFVFDYLIREAPLSGNGSGVLSYTVYGSFIVSPGQDAAQTEENGLRRHRYISAAHYASAPSKQ